MHNLREFINNINIRIYKSPLILLKHLSLPNIMQLFKREHYEY